MVRVVDGKAVKIEGNPAHPVNRGKICAAGQSGLQLLYNPDRIKRPMRKVEAKGSNTWEPIDWEEALELLAERLKALRGSGQAHKVALLSGAPRGMADEILSRFMEVLGSPNHIRSDSTASVAQAFYLAQGIDGLMAYDFENSNYILSFSSNFLTSWPSPVQSMSAYAYLRQGRPGKKARIIQVEPRFSITASRADRWIPIEPGTEGLLALGIAYVLIKESLYDRGFIEKFTSGFEDWKDGSGDTHIGLKNLILERYPLEYVSESTGISADTIVSLAKDFAANKPAVAVFDSHATDYSNGLYNGLAIHALNAMMGSIDVRGGVLVKRKVLLQDLPPVSLDGMARKSLMEPRIDCSTQNQFPLASSNPCLLPENILGDKPYPLEMLFLYKSNPIFSSPNAAEFRKAFGKIPFIVSFSSFLDESSSYADLILPDSTFLEKWQYVESSDVSKYPVLGIAQPVVAPLLETRAVEDVALDLSQRMGPQFAGHFPWKDSKEFLLHKVDTLFKAGRGTIFTDPFEEAQLKLLEERGWWVPQFSTAGEFNEELMKKGGWWDPAYDYGTRSAVYGTPSRRVEFYSHLFARRLKKVVEPLRSEGREEKEILKEVLQRETVEDELFMPHYEEPQFEGDDEEYPFYLQIYNPIGFFHDHDANIPWFHEIMGFHLNMNWDSWAEINPEAAHELGIRDGDSVWIESVHGKIRTRAKLYAGMNRDVVSLPYGLGHEALGRWAKERGVNPVQLLGSKYDPITGQPLKSSVRIKIFKA